MVAALSVSPPAVLRREFVFKKAPFRQCHAATLAESDGGMVAAWFAGDHEGAANVAIYVARKRPGGGWTRPIRAASGSGTPCWNPVLYQPSAGPLMLFYKVGENTRVWKGMVATSKDGGGSWDAPRPLPEGILGPIKNKPIALADGTLLCGSSDEAGGWRVHMERLSDGGQRWSRTPPLNDPHDMFAIQPSLLPMGGACVRAVGRTRQSRMFALDSSDGGRTWGPMRLTDVPNSDSGIDALRLKDGRYLLAYDDATHGRSPLRLAVSTDAEHWTNVLTLESGKGEYSYPAIVQSDDGLVHVAYTWKRRRIRHVVVDPSRL